MNKTECGLVGMWLGAAFGAENQYLIPQGEYLLQFPYGASLRDLDITWPAPLAGWLEKEFGPELHTELGAMFLLQTMALEREDDGCNQISWGIYFNVLVRAIYGYPMFQCISDGVRGAYAYYKSIHMDALFREHFGWLLTNNWSVAESMKGETIREKISIALFCAYITEKYTHAIIRAVTWGGDTYTIGALAGLLAGAVYGDQGFPADWIDSLGDGYVLSIALSMINEYDPLKPIPPEEDNEDETPPPPKCIPFVPGKPRS